MASNSVTTVTPGTGSSITSTMTVSAAASPCGPQAECSRSHRTTLPRSPLGTNPLSRSGRRTSAAAMHADADPHTHRHPLACLAPSRPLPILGVWNQNSESGKTCRSAGRRAKPGPLSTRTGSGSIHRMSGSMAEKSTRSHSRPCSASSRLCRRSRSKPVPTAEAPRRRDFSYCFSHCFSSVYLCYT
jgi:hypothetical protein